MLFLSVLISFCSIHAQSKQYVRADTSIFQKVGGNAEVIIQNATRNLTNTFLKNAGGGRVIFANAIDSLWYSGGILYSRRGTDTVQVGGIGSGGAISSVFTRTGAIVATEADYQAFYPRLSQSYVNPLWITSLPWTKIISTPTTLSGYGITDPVVVTSSFYPNPSWLTTLAWSKITGAPTTLSGFGITDPVVLTSTVYNNPSWINTLAWSKITGTPNYVYLNGLTRSNDSIRLKGRLLDPTSLSGFSTNSFTLDSTIFVNKDVFGAGMVMPVIGVGARFEFYGRKAAISGGYFGASAEREDANSGNYSTSFGFENVASGQSSTGLGASGTASGSASFTSGQHNTASGNYSAASGLDNTASGLAARAEGYNITVSGNYSSAKGSSHNVSGDYSFATGTSDNVPSTGSSVLGIGLWSNKNNQVIVGQYNDTTISSRDLLFVVSGGWDNTHRSNKMWVDSNSNLYAKALTDGTWNWKFPTRAANDTLLTWGDMRAYVASLPGGLADSLIIKLRRPLIAINDSTLGIIVASTIDSGYITNAMFNTWQSKQAGNAHLTAISGLTASNNDLLMYIAGEWANRTPAQAKTTLAIANTDVSGLGTLSTLNSVDLSTSQATGILTTAKGGTPSGGTAGQVLVKNSSTSYDYSWGTGGGTITGGGAANQLAYYSSSTAITSSANATFNGSTFDLTAAFDWDGATYNGNTTKTKPLVQDTTTGLLYRQNGTYIDMTGFSVNDLAMYNGTNFVKETPVNIFFTGDKTKFDSILISNGTVAEDYVIRNRNIGLGFPVVAFKPAGITKNIAFDIMPVGIPGNYSGEGITWLDICNANVAPGTGNVYTARVGVTDSTVQFGMRTFGLPKVPIHFVMDTYTAMKIGTDSTVYINTVIPKTVGDPYKLSVNGGVYQNGIFILNKTTTSSTFPTMGGPVPIANFVYNTTSTGPTITMTGANGTGAFLNFYKTGSTNAGTPVGVAEYSDIGAIIMQTPDHLNTFRYAGYLKMVLEDTTNNATIGGWNIGDVLANGTFNDRMWITSNTVVVHNPGALPAYNASNVALYKPWQFYVAGKARIVDTLDNLTILTTSDSSIRVTTSGWLKRVLANNVRIASTVTNANSDATPFLQIGDNSNTPNPAFRYGVSVAPTITNLLSGGGFYGYYVNPLNTSTAWATPVNFFEAGHFEGTSNTTVSALGGLVGVASMRNSSGGDTASVRMNGIIGVIATNGAGTKKIPSAAGVQSYEDMVSGGAVTITNLFNFKADNNTTAPGWSIGNLTQATITNLYGFYYSHPSTGTVSNEYAIYTEAGNVFLGGLPSSSSTTDSILVQSGGQLKMRGQNQISSVGTSLVVINDADYTIASGVTDVVYKHMTALRTLTLPTAASSTNRKITIKNGGDGAFNISLSIAIRQNSATTTSLVSGAGNEGFTIVSDGTDWWIVAHS